MLNKTLIVGAGFSGAVIARELADAGHPVCLIERRNHIGGNAHDHVNEHGIRIHTYGPHLFHTANEEVFAWLSRFTDWLPYQHRVKAILDDGRLVTLPVNAETAAIIGRDRLLDVLFRPYSKKMWGMQLEDMDPEILRRVPMREDMNELYFPSDPIQCMPALGFTALFERMLDHPLIELRLGTAFERGMEAGFVHCFNSMAIDEYFDHNLGVLPYRSIKFHTVTLPMPQVLPVAVVNFTHDLPYTRVTEWKHLPGNPRTPFTTLTYEEPCAAEDNHFERYYPVKDLRGVNRETYKRYLQQVPSGMTFIGRCGQYVYLDMHQAVSSALAAAQRHLKGLSMP
jgi:UDP-galactopyranose mutase